eukprot:IDg13669t1
MVFVQNCKDLPTGVLTLNCACRGVASIYDKRILILKQGSRGLCVSYSTSAVSATGTGKRRARAEDGRRASCGAGWGAYSHLGWRAAQQGAAQQGAAQQGAAQQGAAKTGAMGRCAVRIVAISRSLCTCAALDLTCPGTNCNFSACLHPTRALRRRRARVCAIQYNAAGQQGVCGARAQLRGSAAVLAARDRLAAGDKVCGGRWARLHMMMTAGGAGDETWALVVVTHASQMCVLRENMRAQRVLFRARGHVKTANVCTSDGAMAIGAAVSWRRVVNATCYSSCE